LSLVCLVPHRLCGETIRCKGLFKRLSLMNKDIEYFGYKALLKFLIRSILIDSIGGEA